MLKKYLKYKNKYLNLKNQLVGGAMTINLDNYKRLFREFSNFDIEIGLNLHYDKSSNKTSFEITKGSEISQHVSIPYNSVVLIHSHPIYYNKDDDYNPPSNYDYVESCFGYYSGIQESIIIDNEGIWLYRPTNELIKLIEKIEPESRELYNYRSELTEGKIDLLKPHSDDLKELIDIILMNSDNNHKYLNFNIRSEKFYLEDEFIKNFIAGKLNELVEGSQELYPILIDKSNNISKSMNEAEIKENIIKVRKELLKDQLNPDIEDIFYKMGLMQLDNKPLSLLKDIFTENYVRLKIQQFINGDSKDAYEILSPIAKEELKTYSLAQLKEMFSHLHKITLEEYIHEMRNLIGSENHGFDVRFIKYDEPFDINIELNDRAKQIFKELKERGYLLTEEDRDFIISSFPKTVSNHIIKRS